MTGREQPQELLTRILILPHGGNGRKSNEGQTQDVSVIDLDSRSTDVTYMNGSTTLDARTTTQSANEIPWGPNVF